MSLTVACVFVQGEYPYTVEYVHRLERMVHRWIDRPYTFVVLTDRPSLLPEVDTIPIQKLPGCYAWWTKLELFNPARQWLGRIFYLDLDMVIVAPLGPVLDHPAPLVLIPEPAKVGHQRRTDPAGHRIVRGFNSSAMLWTAGEATDLYTTWTPDVAQRIATDQCYIGERYPTAATWAPSWFPRLAHLVRVPQFAETGGPMPPDAKALLVKGPKNDVVTQSYPWFDALWGGAA